MEALCTAAFFTELFSHLVRLAGTLAGVLQKLFLVLNTGAPDSREASAGLGVAKWVSQHSPGEIWAAVTAADGGMDLIRTAMIGSLLWYIYSHIKTSDDDHTMKKEDFRRLLPLTAFCVLMLYSVPPATPVTPVCLPTTGQGTVSDSLRARDSANVIPGVAPVVGHGDATSPAGPAKIITAFPPAGPPVAAAPAAPPAQVRNPGRRRQAAKPAEPPGAKGRLPEKRQPAMTGLTFEPFNARKPWLEGGTVHFNIEAHESVKRDSVKVVVWYRKFRNTEYRPAGVTYLWFSGVEEAMTCERFIDTQGVLRKGLLKVEVYHQGKQLGEKVYCLGGCNHDTCENLSTGRRTGLRALFPAL